MLYIVGICTSVAAFCLVNYVTVLNKNLGLFLLSSIMLSSIYFTVVYCVVLYSILLSCTQYSMQCVRIFIWYTTGSCDCMNICRCSFLRFEFDLIFFVMGIFTVMEPAKHRIMCNPTKLYFCQFFCLKSVSFV